MDSPITINVFIDTEFTDFVDPQLISIGMAAETGEEFYAELPYDVRQCSEFVREVVLPMLGYTSTAQIAREQLCLKLTSWLRSLHGARKTVRICYDYQTDWDLFVEALEGDIPRWCTGWLVADRIDDSIRQEYHHKNRLPEHHALNDARANRHAFCKPAN